MNVGTVEAGAEFSYGLKITGEKLGKFTLVVGLDSNKTEMVTGEKEVGRLSLLHTHQATVLKTNLIYLSVIYVPRLRW